MRDLVSCKNYIISATCLDLLIPDDCRRSLERRDATAMTTSSTSTATITRNPKIQAENKTTNENILKTPSGKNSSNEKEKEKDTVYQNSTENMNGHKNVEKEVRNALKKDNNLKARTTIKVSILGDSIIKHRNDWELTKKVSSD